MATLLLIVIYIGYIGLGLPDSLLGTAWPLMHEELGVPVWLAGYITPVMSVFTIISSVCSSRVINRFGAGRTAAVSTALTVLGLFGFYLTPNVRFILLCAIPLGFGAGAVDAALNGYVAQHYSAMHMNFLHCSYGVGVSLSPFIMSIALEKLGSWRLGYRNAGMIQLCIAAVMFLALPLWKRVKHDEENAAEFVEAETVPIHKLARIKGVPWVWLCFFCSCGIEFMCGTWGSTFLVNAKGFTADDAAQMIMFYYIGMALGRFLAGVLSQRMTSWQLIFTGFGLLAAAMMLLNLPLPPVVSCVGLFLIGLGNGPIYPNFMHLTPRNFGVEISQSVIGSQMAAANIGVMLIPFLYGQLVKITGLSSFPVYIGVLYIILVFAGAMLKRTVGKARQTRN